MTDVAVPMEDDCNDRGLNRRESSVSNTDERAVVQALRNPKYTFRTVRGLAAATNLSEDRVAAILADLSKRGLVRRSYRPHRQTGEEMWVLLERLKKELVDLKGKLDKQAKAKAKAKPEPKGKAKAKPKPEREPKGKAKAKAKPKPEPKGKGDDDLEADVRELATEAEKDKPDEARLERLYHRLVRRLKKASKVAKELGKVVPPVVTIGSAAVKIVGAFFGVPTTRAARVRPRVTEHGSNFR
jgi:DNA-binding MarR family transcriptional regulator